MKEVLKPRDTEDRHRSDNATLPAQVVQRINVVVHHAVSRTRTGTVGTRVTSTSIECLRSDSGPISTYGVFPVI